MRYCCERAQKGATDMPPPLCRGLEVKRNTYLVVRIKPNTSPAKTVGKSGLPDSHPPTRVPNTSAYFVRSIHNYLSRGDKECSLGT